MRGLAITRSADCPACREIEKHKRRPRGSWLVVEWEMPQNLSFLCFFVAFDVLIPFAVPYRAVGKEVKGGEKKTKKNTKQKTGKE